VGALTACGSFSRHDVTVDPELPTRQIGRDPPTTTTESQTIISLEPANFFKMLRGVNCLIKEIRRMPFEGTGEPEPLKNDLSAGGPAGSLMNTGS
jgi:hypothetical protein